MHFIHTLGMFSYTFYTVLFYFIFDVLIVNIAYVFNCVQHKALIIKVHDILFLY